MKREAEPGPEAFQIGERVIWKHQPRRGWGYSYPIDGEVVRTGKVRVTIPVKKKNGTKRQVTVRSENLVRHENETRLVVRGEG